MNDDATAPSPEGDATQPAVDPDAVRGGGFDQPYGLPNYRYDGHIADLTVPLGFWRSVGNSMNAFFLESFVDELAHASKHARSSSAA